VGALRVRDLTTRENVEVAPDGSAVSLFRSMKVDTDGLPSVGPTARELGVRPGDDIPVDNDGYVEPLTGGISVSPVAADRLPEHRRPPEVGGTGKDPVWTLTSDLLAATLRYRPDDEDPDGHGTIEPVSRMTLDAYQQALRATRSAWTLVESP
jgi:hypothetical protein